MTNDPIEAIIASALDDAGLLYNRHNDKNLDFFVPQLMIYIECKQFHTERISEQTKRVPNIIVIQGRHAAETFAQLVRKAYATN